MREGMSLQTRRELLQHMLPQYREASTVKKKSKLLDAFTAATGYNRKYAMGLLNHAQVEQSTPQRPRPRRYWPEVQHALFLVWHAANRICAKRLIPFLPTVVEALERHEHLHLTEECRSQLLSMSAATADRLLRFQRKLGLRGLSTTRAGTLLKQQILSWLVANPERSSGDIFRELQRRSPGRSQPLQIRTLQRGMRKIRASLLETVEEQWQAEVIHGRSPQPVSSAANPARSF